MSKHVQWLAEQLRLWVSQGLISEDQAGSIRRLYPEPKAGLPWGTILFAGLGAVIVGLGVILVFAYNWHALPKWAKLGLVLATVAGTQGAGLCLYRREDWCRQLGEALCLLGTMFFGAGIWLIAQVYHIDEHYPTGFLWWGLGALAMAWALPSVSQALLALVVLSIWQCSEAWGFQHPWHGAPLVLLAGVGPLAWRLRSRLLTPFLIPALLLAVTAQASAVDEVLIVPVLSGLAATCIAAGKCPRMAERLPGAGAALAGWGWPVLLVCAYLLGFSELGGVLLGGEEYRHARPRGFASLAYAWGPAIMALAAWGALAREKWSQVPDASRAPTLHLEELLVPLTALAWPILASGQVAVRGLMGAAVANLVCLALAVAWMARGCRQARLAPTVCGSLLLAAIAAARYFDLFQSLAARGVVFMAVGGALIAEGVIYTRTRRRLVLTGPRLPDGQGPAAALGEASKPEGGL